jgi:hypothetical protein
MQDEQSIKDQIARCRRIARQVVDDDIRHALEDLAVEYEARLPESGVENFMLSGEDGGGRDAR